MKTKITYLAALVCALTFATSSFADTEAGFYEKDHIRGFISIGADYRGMFSEFQKYVNAIAFVNGGQSPLVKDSASSGQEYYGDFEYSEFDDYYIGLHVNIGAQYKQFLTWFDINFMPSQVSERPDDFYIAESESGDQMAFPLYDVRWFAYGADWMFGWKLFGENTVVNLIPAIGVGFNLINFHMASNFDVVSHEEGGETVRMRDRYYSTIANTFNAEMELRLEFGPIAIGAYGGYRYIRYNDLSVEGNRLETTAYDTDNVGDTWFAGVRLTWIFRSEWQRKQDDKL